jgi:O-antigen ligase
MDTDNRILDSSESVLVLKHSNWFLVILISLFFGYPAFSYISFFLGIESSAVSILCRALQLLAVLLYTIFLLKRNLFRITHPIFFIFFTFWIFYSIRIVHDTTALQWKLGLPVNQYYLFGIVMGFLMSIPLFVKAPIDNQKFERYSFWILLFLNILSFGYNLQQDALFAYRLGGNEKLNPISSSFLAVWLICLSLKNWFFFSQNHKKSKVLYIPIIIICLGNMLIASTKMTFIFLIIFIFGVIFGTIKERRYHVLFFIIASLTALVFIAIGTGYYDLFELIFFRFQDISDDQSSQERVMMIEGAIKQFLENPIQGSFLEEYQLSMYPHNTVLEAFMATGILGGSLYIIFFMGFFIRSVYLFFSTRFSLIAQIAFGHVFLALLSGSLAFGIDTWQIMAIVYASTSMQKANKPFKIENRTETD